MTELPEQGNGLSKMRRLLPRHFQIIDLALAGHNPKVIGETVGMPSNSISMILKSPLVQAEIAQRRKQSQEENILGVDRDLTMGKARIILEKATEKAAMQLERLVDTASNESVRLRAATSILDRVFGAKDGQTGGVVVNITADQINLLNQALKESNNEKPTANQAPAHDPQAQELGAVQGEAPEPAEALGPGPSEAQGVRV